MKSKVYSIFFCFVLLISCKNENPEPESPLVFTLSPNEINSTSAILNGNIILDGRVNILEKGFSLRSKNGMFKNYRTYSKNLGEYNEKVSGLKPCTEYEYFAYVITDIFHIKGELTTFMTLEDIPKVVTAGNDDFSEHTDEYLQKYNALHGRIETCSNSINKFGIYYSDKNETPDTNSQIAYGNVLKFKENDKDSTGTGDFTVWLSELEPNTTYYYSAFATNTSGTGLGEVKMFKNKWGRLVDSRDEKVYRYTKIGNQTWMADNLAYLPEVYPGGIIAPEKAYYVFDYYGTDTNEAKMYDAYYGWGVLYNWNAALDACPEGWHLPTADEWEQLAQYISTQSNGYSRKVDSTFNYLGYWDEVGKLLQDEHDRYGNLIYNFGFLANFGGFWSQPNQNFYSLWDECHFWTATEYNVDQNKGISYKIFREDSFLYWNSDYKSLGFSVRCVKD